MTLVFLDSGPLGLITNPRASPTNDSCRIWLASLVAAGVTVVVPEIADYEVRRELLRAGKTGGVRRLDHLRSTLEYLPITTEVMHLAAVLWAEARQRGRPTADDRALDGDVILASQARIRKSDGESFVVATVNVSHLSLFVPAGEWRYIQVV